MLRPGAIGDTLLAGPALLALRRRWPDRRLVLVGNASLAALLRASGWADALEPFDSTRVAGLFADPASVPAETAAWLRDVGGAVLWLSGPSRVRRTLQRLGVPVLVEAPGRPLRPGVHAADHLVASLEPLGIGPSDAPPWAPVTPPAAARAWASGFLRAQGLTPGRYLAIQPGSGSRTKNWPAERFAALAGLASQHHGLGLLALGGPAEEDEALAPLRAAGAAIGQRLELAPVAALLGAAAAYVGNDSGISHLAAAVGAPTLALFGPTDPATWAPRGPRVSTLRHEPLAALDPAAVLAALDRLLAADGGAAPR